MREKEYREGKGRGMGDRREGEGKKMNVREIDRGEEEREPRDKQR